MEGENDHVHLLIDYPPKLAVLNLVKSLKVCKADYFVVIAQTLLHGITTTGFCEPQATLPVAAEVHQYASSGNTLSNSKHLVKWKTAPYIPALKDGILRCTG